VDTFKVLETTGAKDAVLYGQGSTTELGELEDRLKDGEEILALFCEFPGNPLLRSPDMKPIVTLQISTILPLLVMIQLAPSLTVIFCLTQILWLPVLLQQAMNHV
jgi:cystathionine beta-lyase/cystathionine gamma-synthase